MTTVNATYTLANYANYKFEICNIGENVYDQQSYLFKDNFKDVKITRPNRTTDMSALNDKAIISVNGLIHSTSVANNELYIPNAMTSLLTSKLNNVGILSFNQLKSPLRKFKVLADMVSTEPSTTLYDKAIITFDQPIGNAFIVIAGYMIFEQPEFFYRVSDSSFVLRLDRLGYIDKLYELNRYRDIFGELGIPKSPTNPLLIDAEVARSNEAVLKLLTTHNTFLVEVPCAQLTTQKIFLDHSSLPGNFRCEVEPIYPIIVGTGKIGEYIKTRKNDNKFTVYCGDAYYNNYVMSSVSEYQAKLFNANRLPDHTYQLTNAFFLRIDMQE